MSLALPDHTLPDHVLTDHVLTDHVLTDHSLTDHTLTDHTLPSGHVPELVEWLRVRVAEFAMIEPAAVDPDQPLTDYGLDSVYAVSLCAELHDTFGVVVDPGDTVSHPTVLSLALHLGRAGFDDHGRWVR